MLTPKFVEASFSAWCQGDLNLSMRWTLFNWLLDVASADAMNLDDACLPLAFSLVDAYLIAARVQQKKILHTLGMTCLMLSAKMNCVRYTNADDFVFFLDDEHARSDDLFRMEREILTTLNFTILHCGHVHDFQVVSDSNEDAATRWYLNNLLLLEPIYCKWSPWQVANGLKFLEDDALPPPLPAPLAPPVPRQVLADIVDAIHAEKSRIEAGKRTALQRKHVQLTGDTKVMNNVFLQLGRWRQKIASITSIMVEEEVPAPPPRIITRSISRKISALTPVSVVDVKATTVPKAQKRKRR